METLPPEILHMIDTYLSQRSRQRLRSTNKHIRDGLREMPNMDNLQKAISNVLRKEFESDLNYFVSHLRDEFETKVKSTLMDIFKRHDFRTKNDLVFTLYNHMYDVYHAWKPVARYFSDDLNDKMLDEIEGDVISRSKLPDN